jgi:hypothetical protein
MRLRTLTFFIRNAPRNQPPVPSWWQRSMARAFLMVKPGGAQPAVRLTKGRKPNRKKMATVAAVFTRAPWVRTPEQVVESLFRTHRQNPANGPTPPRPENKRVWASLLKGKTAVIQEVAQEMQRRDPGNVKTRVALTDGERALQ